MGMLCCFLLCIVLHECIEILEDIVKQKRVFVANSLPTIYLR